MPYDMTQLDAHEQLAPQLKAIWKEFARTEQADLLRSSEIDDPRNPAQAGNFKVYGTIPAAQVEEAWKHIGYISHTSVKDAEILYHPLVPGLHIVLNLIPHDAQRIILDRTVHRDLSNPEHQTNLHLHYNIPYPSSSSSFFTYPPNTTTSFEPKDPFIHKSLSLTQVLNRRLSWMTLGGQFDWTNRIYPGTVPPDFPQDLGNFLHSLFPQTVAQAAIVNFYTPGDTMMMHRDVSEKTDRGLISLSIGCDSLFMIAPNNVDWETAMEQREKLSRGEIEEVDKRFLLLRIHSGDVVYMTEESRYAWHGVPKVFKDTCPEELAEWPAGEAEGEYEEWRGWLRNKRVNINVRQME